MISHWWGGRFADFIAAVDQIVADRALSICTVLWVCTFANNQFGEYFGSRIMDTPFARAIMNADATILIVDRDAGSLTRSWCCLELHCTITMEKLCHSWVPFLHPSGYLDKPNKEYTLKLLIFSQP